MSDVLLTPASEPFVARLAPPGSKSLTNRALILAALADGSTQLHNILLADDTRVMFDSLRQLGFALELDEANRSVIVHGRGGRIPAAGAELFCGNSGTTIRFCAALAALGDGEFIFDGIDRMRQRPIGELVELLRNMGTRIDYSGQVGYPPLRLRASGLAGGILAYGAAQSSQYLSAVLMVSPFARHEVRIDLAPGQTSWPYAVMTMRLMDEFGLTPELQRDPETAEPRQIVIPRHRYAPTQYTVEPDASNASYFLALAAIHPGSRVTINGLGKSSLQGDVGFADVLHRMGAGLIFDRDSITVIGNADLQGIDIDLSAMPDTAQTLAVVALFAKGETIIRGLKTLRVKETDRLAALRTELARLGADVDIDADALIIQPPDRPTSARIETYDDHRMAMSFALAATRWPDVTIRDADCVNKTYPDFFQDLRGALQSR